MDLSEEIYSCLNQVRYAEDLRSEAFDKILSHPTIAKKIEWEANRFSSINPEFTKEDLKADITRILYESILKEWNKKKDKEKSISFCCSRIAWRTSTFIAKELELERTIDEEGKGVYTRPSKSEITEEVIANIRQDHPNDESKSSLMTDIIRDANIETKYKHPLIYVLVLGCNFKELSRYYRCTAPTASTIYKKSLAAFKDYVNNSSKEEAEAIFEAIRELLND